MNSKKASKKKRGSNYTQSEKDLVLELIKKWQHIIENKETNGGMIKKKREAWDTVCQQYNAVAVSGKRTWQQLRHLYDNMKQRIKQPRIETDCMQLYKQNKQLQEKATFEELNQRDEASEPIIIETRDIDVHQITMENVNATSSQPCTGASDTEDSDHSSSEESASLGSELLNFFDKEPGNRARCSMCGSILKRHPDVLYKHLQEQHYRISENLEECYPEVVYLEEPEAPTEPKKPKYDQFVECSKPKPKPKRRYSREPLKTSNEQEPVNNIDKHEQEIENFVKYITGLLKGVPKFACTKLQMDIVDLIVTSKLENLRSTKARKVNATKESDIENDITVEENTNLNQNRDNETVEDCHQHSISEPKLDPKKSLNISKTKKRPKSLNYREEMASDLTDHEEKEVDNFGNYMTCLLQSVRNKEIGAKLQMDIVDLIMTVRLKMMTDENARSLTEDIENREMLVDT